MTKQADLDYIKKELKEYLGINFEINKHKLGKPQTAQESVKVKLLYQPNWKKWVNAMFFTGFATWANGVETNLTKIPLSQREALLLKLLKDRPISAVLESAVFVIKIDNIPRSQTHQIVRARKMAFNQESYRVTPAHHAPIRVPEGLTDDQKKLIKHSTLHQQRLYLELINQGVPMEEARNVLPIGTCTHIVMVTNLSALLGYIRARTQHIAQNEHTFIVLKICRELQDKAPKFYKHFIHSEQLEKLYKEYKV